MQCVPIHVHVMVYLRVSSIIWTDGSHFDAFFVCVGLFRMYGIKASYLSMSFVYVICILRFYDAPSFGCIAVYLILESMRVASADDTCMLWRAHYACIVVLSSSYSSRTP